MSSLLRWLIAVLVLAAIVFICVAPSVDLPATTLRGIMFAIAFASVLEILAHHFLSALQPCCSPLQLCSSSAADPPILSERCLCLSLRC